MVRDLRHHIVWAKAVFGRSFLVLFFALFLLHHAGVGCDFLVKEAILLYKLVGVQVPHVELTIVGGRIQASFLLCVVNGSHVIRVIVQRGVSVHCHGTALRSCMIKVFIERAEAPDLDGCVVGAGHEGVSLVNHLDLVYPVGVPVQVREELNVFLSRSIRLDPAFVAHVPQLD